MRFTGRCKGSMGLAALTLGAFAFGIAARAQEYAGGQGQTARAVRLSYVDGSVSVAQGDQVLAEQAVVNTPLFEGEQLTTADDGKAEIQFEDGSVARLAPDSALTLYELRGSGSSAATKLVVDSGLAYFEFQGGGQGGRFGVSFGSTAATPSGFTVLRVDMDAPPGAVAVFSGNVHLVIGDDSTPLHTEANLHGGESIVLNAIDASDYDLAESIEPDSWDAWNSDRDEELTAEAAAQTAAPSGLNETQNAAWDDLDANGNWYDVPSQGYVWSPYEASNPNFDPYGNGNWTWTPGYGYVWASGYPWGYLPFQCGTWNFYGGFGWGWTPGAGGYAPWWQSGQYGGPNVGSAPFGYQPVTRPFPPRRPIVNPGGPSPYRPIPVIHVDRHTVLAQSSLPARDKATPVTIAGSRVHPIQPLPTRAVDTQETFATAGHRSAAEGAGNRPSAWPSPVRPTFYSASRPLETTARPVYSISRPGYSTRPSMSASRGFQPSYSMSRSTNSSGANRSFGGGATRSSGSGSGGFSGGSHGAWGGGARSGGSFGGSFSGNGHP